MSIKRRKWTSEIDYTVIDVNGVQHNGRITENKAMPKALDAEIDRVTQLINASIPAPLVEFLDLEITQRVVA